MKKLTLSVVIPNYNHAGYIGEQLDAILSQSYQPSQVIVVDDASTDNSVEVIEQFVSKSPLVKLIRLRRNQGGLSAAITGFADCDSDYIYFAAADDKVLDGFFETAMDLFARHPNAGLFCSDYAHIDDKGKLTRRYKTGLAAESRYFTADEFTEALAARRCSPIAAQTTIMKRSSLIKAGGLIKELEWYCDWFFIHTIAFRDGVCYAPRFLAARRALENSYSAAGHGRPRDVQRALLTRMMDILDSDEYADVRPRYKRAASLSHFPDVSLTAALSHRKYWGYISGGLIRNVLYSKARLAVASVTPGAVKGIYHRIRESNYECVPDCSK